MELTGKFTNEPYCDPQIKRQLLLIRERVLNKDRDFVAVYDGEEGVGKSVLAMQHAKILDPDFNIDNIVFTSDQFIAKIKDPNTKKGACILLDEAFNAASSRASLTEVNRSMVGLATEMRQKNLFVILVLPSFFDLDKYFALWRCRALFHVYFTPEEDRHYVTFDKETKKLLYLNGKKTYNYSKPKAPFAPASFYNEYVVDEFQYRAKKAEAFKKRTVSNTAKRWLDHRNFLIRYVRDALNINYLQLMRLFKLNNLSLMSERAYTQVCENEHLVNDGSFEDGDEEAEKALKQEEEEAKKRGETAKLHNSPKKNEVLDTANPH